MLTLKNITKNYVIGETIVKALRGISLEFRQNEFVAVLGPSGCGKTTLLNIIGGLDRYTTGDLLINRKSTKEFKERDWDAYRNRSVGFVFQNYNLIPHLSVLGNVELALTISGVSAEERKQRALDALNKVGLCDQVNKRPNQLSGGQMQRVAIARALVNNPDIILADEPTGALDSVTSVQIMDILKQISQERLIIMVTHNSEIANRYSTRIIKLLDGMVIDDSNPYQSDTETLIKVKKRSKTSMSFLTALSLSFRNLLTKKTRTFMTAFAGSIGIIGIALVLALSNGFSLYIGKIQTDTLSGFPISILPSTETDYSNFHFIRPAEGEFPPGDQIYRIDRSSRKHTNIITPDYLSYINAIDPKLYNAIKYTRMLSLHVIGKETDSESINTYFQMTTQWWNEMVGNNDFILKQYDLLSGRMPEAKNEMILVVDSYNYVSTNVLKSLHIPYEGNETYTFNDFIGRQFRLLLNNDFYIYNESNLQFDQKKINETMYENGNAIPLEIVGILRVKEETDIGILNEGLNYPSALTDFVLEDAAKSEIVMAQTEKGMTENVLTGKPFSVGDQGKEEYVALLIQICAVSQPVGLNIYPVNFESKEAIKAYLDRYNEGQEDDLKRIIYTDFSEIAAEMLNTMIESVSYILIAFTAVSLVVSSIMIGIITYVSVIERTKEIGVLRSIGARKKDISRVFNAETVIIGFTAGVIGIAVSYGLTFPISSIIRNLVKEIKANVAVLKFSHSLLLIVVSILLTLVAGLIPSYIAAKKDPVVALRTE